MSAAVASATQTGSDPIQDAEDLHAAAAAVYIVLLAAHARGLAGYWRTPAVLRTEEGREAVGLPEEERVLGLVYLGHPCQDREPPERRPSDEYVTYLA